MKGTVSNLSAPQCWDAALYCAWAAKGVECPDLKVNGSPSDFGVTTAQNYTRIFGTNPPTAKSPRMLMEMPRGCFVGFVSTTSGTPASLHAAHQRGLGCGQQERVRAQRGQCGRVRLDMTQFFLKDANLNANATTKIIYRACKGQTV